MSAIRGAGGPNPPTTGSPSLSPVQGGQGPVLPDPAQSAIHRAKLPGEGRSRNFFDKLVQGYVKVGKVVMWPSRQMAKAVVRNALQPHLEPGKEQKAPEGQAAAATDYSPSAKLNAIYPGMGSLLFPPESGKEQKAPEGQAAAATDHSPSAKLNAIYPGMGSLLFPPESGKEQKASEGQATAATDYSLDAVINAMRKDVEQLLSPYQFGKQQKAPEGQTAAATQHPLGTMFNAIHESVAQVMSSPSRTPMPWATGAFSYPPSAGYAGFAALPAWMGGMPGASSGWPLAPIFPSHASPPPREAPAPEPVMPGRHLRSFLAAQRSLGKDG